MRNITIDESCWIAAPGYEKNVLLTEDELRSAGTCVQLVRISPGETIAGHYHKTSYEVYYVLQGSCQLFVNEEEYWLQPGTIILMEPLDIHRLQNSGANEFLLLVYKTNAGHSDTYWI